MCTRRERGFAAQAPLTGPPPACRSVPPAAPSRLPLRPRTRPPEKSIPRLIKSSTHFRPPLLTRAQEIPKLAVHKFSFRGTRQLLLYLRTDSTVIIASRSRGPGSSSRVPEHSGGLWPANSPKIGKSENSWKSRLCTGIRIYPYTPRCSRRL